MHVFPALPAAFPHWESWLKAGLLRDKILTQQSTWQPWCGSICKAVVNPWGWVRKLLENDVLAGDVPSGAQNPAAPAGRLGDLHRGSQITPPLKPDIPRNDCHEPRTQLLRPCMEDFFPVLPGWAAQAGMFPG